MKVLEHLLALDIYSPAQYSARLRNVALGASGAGALIRPKTTTWLLPEVFLLLEAHWQRLSAWFSILHWGVLQDGLMSLM